MEHFWEGFAFFTIMLPLILFMVAPRSATESRFGIAIAGVIFFGLVTLLVRWIGSVVVAAAQPYLPSGGQILTTAGLLGLAVLVSFVLYWGIGDVSLWLEGNRKRREKCEHERQQSEYIQRAATKRQKKEEELRKRLEKEKVAYDAAIEAALPMILRFDEVDLALYAVVSQQSESEILALIATHAGLQLESRCERQSAGSVEAAILTTATLIQQEFRADLLLKFSDWMRPKLPVLMDRVNQEIPGISLARSAKGADSRDLSSLINAFVFKRRCHSIEQIEAALDDLIDELTNEFGEEGQRQLELQAEQKQEQLRRIRMEDERRQLQRVEQERQRRQQEEQIQRRQERLTKERSRRIELRNDVELTFIEHAAEIHGVFDHSQLEHVLQTRLSDDQPLEEVEKVVGEFPNFVQKLSAKQRLLIFFAEHAVEIEPHYSRNLFHEYMKNNLNVSLSVEEVLAGERRMTDKLQVLIDKRIEYRTTKDVQETVRGIEKKTEGIETIASAVRQLGAFDPTEKQDMVQFTLSAADNKKRSIVEELVKKELSSDSTALAKQQ